MRHAMDTRRHALRNAGLVGLTSVALLLASCAPGTGTFGLDIRLNVTPAVRAGILTVTIPADRPSRGIDVRPSDAPRFHIPPGHYPPPGQCRIWEPGVPPGLQSPPGPCPTLERQVPPGAYLVVG